jgi:hypothetical protein
VKANLNGLNTPAGDVTVLLQRKNRRHYPITCTFSLAIRRARSLSWHFDFRQPLLQKDTWRILAGSGGFWRVLGNIRGPVVPYGIPTIAVDIHRRIQFDTRGLTHAW